MTRREVLAALVAFVVAACASGVADPLIDGPFVDPTRDGGVTVDAGVTTDGGTTTPDSAVPSSNDGLPVDAVIFTFASTCPVGYETYADGVGRFALGAEADIGTTSSATPYAHASDPTHTHTVAGSVNTADVSLAASDLTGGSEHANSANPTVNVTSGATSLGLPYIELRFCRKTGGATAAAPALPQGSVIPFVSATCPDGFATYAPANGRFVAGLPSGGTNATNVGGASMTSGESFVHAHDFSATITLAGINPGGLAGGGVSYAANGAQTFTVPASSVSTTLPFVRLLYCEKL